MRRGLFPLRLAYRVGYPVNPVFSIIMPVYNDIEYLLDALQSIEIQTVHNMEVIVVDDGSQPEKAAVIGDVCETFEWVSLYKIKNSGPLVARNIGAERASGEYLLFLDADDRFRGDALERLQVITTSHHPDVICFGMSTALDFSNCVAQPLSTGFYGDTMGEVRNKVIAGELNNLCSKAIKRSVYLRGSALTGPRRMKMGEDWLQVINIFDHVDTCYAMEKPLYFYRQHNDSSMHQFEESYLSDLQLVFTELLNRAAAWGDSYVLLAQQAIINHLMVACIVFVQTGIDGAKRRAIFESIQDLIARFSVLDFSFRGLLGNAKKLIYKLIILGFFNLADGSLRIYAHFRKKGRLI